MESCSHVQYAIAQSRISGKSPSNSTLYPTCRGPQWPQTFWTGKHYQVLVDSYSGWFEIDLLRNLTSSTVISKLKRHFSVHGTPHTLITDNAGQYTSQHFKDFAKQWDFTPPRAALSFPSQTDWRKEQSAVPSNSWRSRTGMDLMCFSAS